MFKFKKKIILISSTLAVASLLAACSPSVSPNTYSGSDVGVASRVIKGTVIGIRPITIQQNTGLGAIGGGVAGGAAGSMIGGTTAAHVAGAAGGAVVGGLIGNEAEKHLSKEQGYEYIIQINNNSIISVAQAQDLKLSLKQHVLVIYGATTRIVPDNTISLPEEASPKTTAAPSKAKPKAPVAASKTTTTSTAAATPATTSTATPTTK